MSGRLGLSEKTENAIRHLFAHHPQVEKAILFGSRAKGNYKRGSDIDFSLAGRNLTQQIINRLYEELDDLPIPYRFSLVLSSKIEDVDVIAHIERVGILFYEKKPVSMKS